MMDWQKTRVLGIALSVLLLGCAPSPSVSEMEPRPSPEAAQETIAPVAIASSQSLPIGARFAVADRVIQLEVAQTPEQQAIGLMFRESLPDDRGMLFAFEPPRPVQFWMRNTLIPLDMVFLLNGEIQAIIPEVPPCRTEVCPTYGPDMAVNQVIELRGGRAAELGLEVGQQLELELL